MFGNLSHLIPATRKHGNGPPPDSVPPPTPIHLPQCRPRPATPAGAVGSDSGPADTSSPELTTLLQNLTRPTEQVDISHLELLGVQVSPDVPLTDLIPDPTCLPDFDKWDSLSREEAQALSAEPQPDLCNGRKAPGAAKYVDLRLGLLNDNGRAFRAVNRVSPRPGEPVVRLGYCHEFFRDLESVTGFWDDTSVTRTSDPKNEKPTTNEEDKQAEEPSAEAMELCKQATADNDEAIKEIIQPETHDYYRTMVGTAMPAQFRTKLLTSFLKLVTYDFSCNIMSRQGPEPRLYIKSPASTSSATSPKHSYFSSGCNFLFRTPVDRDLAKRGIIDGPIVAVSPRHTTLFPPRGKEREAVIDLSREIIGALITAQNRSREGKQEQQIGKDAWWTTRRRWGGGPGGPVGREEELVELKKLPSIIPANADEKLSVTSTAVQDGEALGITRSSPVVSVTAAPVAPLTACRSRGRSSSSGSPASSSSTQPPNAKRPRTQLAAYDAYRMVRPPSIHWDPQTRYTAIGRQQGVDYDDVFVISSLFHHISLLRVRVPDKLLAVLSGAVADTGVHARGAVEVWRTRWFDFFIAQDRVDAMKALWAVMAYAMRRVETVGPPAPATDNDGAKKDSPRR